MKACKAFELFLAGIVGLCLLGHAYAQEEKPEKPCTYSIRSDSNWMAQALIGPDVNGEVVGHSVRTSNGSCTYLVDVGSGKQLLKLYLPTGETKELGDLARLPGSNGVTFTPVGGSPIAGNIAIPLSKGILLLRENATFIYEVGKPVAAHTAPSGWSPYPLQAGDVLGTQAVLVVKTTDAGGTFGIGGTKAASLLRVPESKVRFGLWDLQQKVITAEFETQGRSQNQYLMMAAGPKGDWPYKFNPLIRPSESTAFISSPADWFVAGDQRILVHFDKSLTEVWMRDLSNGKSRLAVKNPLGILSFYVPFRDGAYAFVSEGTRFFKDVASAIEAQ